MRNYYIFSMILAVFCVSLIVTGFLIVGSPNEQKSATLDTNRLAHFSYIHDAVLAYYQTNYKLPPSLEALQEDETNINELVITDPETNKPYTYEALANNEYQLCTEFSSDTTGTKVTTSDSYTYGYNLPQDAQDLTHKKGYDCINITIPPSYTTLKYEDDDYHYSLIPNVIATEPSVELIALDKIDDCEWNAAILLQGFSPNTEFYVRSEGTLSENCDSGRTQPYEWVAGPGGKADRNGNTLFNYTQEDYGDYTYTITDLDGNTAAVRFSYDEDSKEPVITTVNSVIPVTPTPNITIQNTATPSAPTNPPPSSPV